MSQRVKVDKLVPGGHGLCRDGDGVFFVDGVAAGEVIDVDVDRKKRGARRGRLLRVVEPSPERVVPDCGLVARCGGCDWLHLSRAAQTTGKAQIVDDSLVRVGRFAKDDVAGFRRALVVAPDDAPRRRARFVVDRDGRLSFSQRDSHDRVVIDACPALDPRISALLPRLPKLVPGDVVRLAVDDRGVKAGVDDRRDAAALRGFVDGVVVDGASADEAALLVGEVTAGQFGAVSDALTFAQATRFGGAAIRDLVVAAARPSFSSKPRLLELFAGSGHLTLPLSHEGARVTAVEGDGRALGFLRRNADAAGFAVSVKGGFIDEGTVVDADVEVVVADPPRTGIPGAALLFARMTRVQRLVLVSCDPATGARDLRAAVDAGFVVDSVTPIDAFPRTHHVEWVASLSRAQAGS